MPIPKVVTKWEIDAPKELKWERENLYECDLVRTTFGEQGSHEDQVSESKHLEFAI